MSTLQFNQCQIEDLEERLPENLLRLFPNTTVAERRAIWKDMKEDVMDEMTSYFERAMQVVHLERERKNIVKQAVLEFQFKDGSIRRVWALDARERASLAEHRSFQFGGGTTAGIVYEAQEPHGYRATENNLREPSTWAWIQEWMEKGFRSEGLLADK